MTRSIGPFRVAGGMTELPTDKCTLLTRISARLMRKFETLQFKAVATVVSNQQELSSILY